uniref:CSON006578 protein n=1 Tax=Culicoides sonorensis TaxID=179676 RepID=A0A336LWK1_CULSO
MGSKKCCVPSCDSNSSKPEDAETTFHKFPQRLEFRKNWITAMKSTIDATLQPSSSNLICSRHFRTSDWQEIKGGKLMLKQGIIPSVFSWNIDKIPKEELSKPEITGNSNVSVKETNEESKDEKSDEKKEVKEETKPVEDKKPSRKSLRRSKLSLTPTTSGKIAKIKEKTEVEKAPTEVKEEKEPKVEEKETEKEKEPVEVKKTPEKKVDDKKPEVKKEKSETSTKEETKSSTKFSIKLPFKSKKDKKRVKDIRKPHRSILTSSKRVQKRKAGIKTGLKSKLKTPTKSSSSTTNTTPKKPATNSSINFTIGTKLEAQDFEGGWHEACIVEVDSDEGEALIHFIKNEKLKSAVTLTDEWIPQDSCRLRPIVVQKKSEGFAIGEKCMARWNDSRKFPATVQRLVEDDLYEVLFNDGYVKIVRGTHMTKLKQQPGQPPLIEQVVPLPVPVIPAPAIQDIVIPDIPKDGEWCCYWINDCPVGKESYLDFAHGRINTIIVDDWRLPEGWTRHLFQRIGNYGGKWDAILVSADGTKFRSKQELKLYLDAKKEPYDPEKYDFCLHKKRAKAIGLLTYTEDYKQALSLEMKSPNASLASIGTPGTPGGLNALGNGEVYIGSLKVTVKDHLYLCPDCDKTFRKENHLQIHIKHYHEKTAELLGVCPNMQDLAYLRTATDDTEVMEVQSKFMKKSLNVGSPTKPGVPGNATTSETPTPSTPVTNIKSPSTPKSGNKSNSNKKLTESVLKRDPVVKLEVMNMDDHLPKPKSNENDPDFDPEAAIVSHEVSKKSQKKRKFAVSTRQCNRKLNKRQKLSESGNSTGLTDSEDTRFSFGQGDQPSHPRIGKLQSDNTHDGSSSFETSPSPSNYVNEFGEVIKIVRMRKEEVINCICAYPEEDGLMIQCELCLCWQHGICNGIVKESQVPDKYVCLICRNPQRGRPSMRFVHDQDWLYDGKLPTANYHLPYQKTQERFNILKQSHTLTGNLLELKKFLHSLDVKINIAANKDHPKMYLWSKKWESSPPKNETQSVSNPQPLKVDNDIKFDIKDLNAVGDNGQNNSILAGLLSSPGGTIPVSSQVTVSTTAQDIDKEDEKKEIIPQEPKTPSAPEPEAAIDPAKCQYNLLEHIQKQQNLAMARLNTVEAQIIALEAMDDHKDEDESPLNPDSYTKTKQVVHQLIKDLEKMKALAEIHGSVPAY